MGTHCREDRVAEDRQKKVVTRLSRSLTIAFLSSHGVGSLGEFKDGPLDIEENPWLFLGFLSRVVVVRDNIEV